MDGSQVHDEALLSGGYASIEPAERQHAVRMVASQAIDAADCRLLLEILGLDVTDGKR
jgi:hypothetical protein